MNISTSEQQAIDALPDLPKNDAGPVFAEPWQAQVFSMTCLLHERQLFTWTEWASTLGSVIKEEPDDTEYYQCWLKALEKITTDKALLSNEALLNCKNAWDRAARATPHGMPIELGAEEKL